ncbi:transposase [Streptomyces sp. NRRL B-2790]|uniref:transposase n=1 Tax=Streptomyces sp. NRRL B-2790 TaxID=1463835 RepID=UPI000A61C833
MQGQLEEAESWFTGALRLARDLDDEHRVAVVLRRFSRFERARAQAKSGDGLVEIARIYKLAKGSAVKARAQAINQLKAVLVGADPNLREELAVLHNAELFRTCAELADDGKNGDDGEEAVLQATRITLCLLAQRIGQLTEQIQDLEGRLARLVERHAPQLLTVVGIGPDAAVTLLITVGDNPERLGSKASFAALCGVSPVERSSGTRQYRRLNRGGDRQANAALHRIVQTRLRFDPRTQDYYERRIKEGKTRREIVRRLERYAAREAFHLVRSTQPCPRHRGTVIAGDTAEPLGNHPEHLAEPGAVFGALGRARGGPGTQCEHGGVIAGLGRIRGRQGANAGGHRGVRRGGGRVRAAAGHVGEALRFGQGRRRAGPARRSTPADLLTAGAVIGDCLADERLVDQAKTLARHRPRLARRGGGQPGNPTGEDPYGMAGDIGLDRQPKRLEPGFCRPSCPTPGRCPGPRGR